MKKLLLGVMTVFSASIFTAHADDTALLLQQGWDKTKYELTGKEQMHAYEALIAQADKAVSADPKNAEVLAWSGIIKSTYAGAKGGLGALKFAKAGKADLEQALAVNDKVLSGAAYNTLGTLMFRVPGWPVGFGDKKKAEQMLKKALEINPTGIDANFFYGEFLRDRGDYQAALSYYEKALAAPARPERPLADAGRRAEIEKAVKEVKAKL